HTSWPPGVKRDRARSSRRVPVADARGNVRPDRILDGDQAVTHGFGFLPRCPPPRTPVPGADEGSPTLAVPGQRPLTRQMYDLHFERAPVRETRGLEAWLRCCSRLRVGERGTLSQRRRLDET